MSVLLTACRKSRQNAIERALKKKAEKKKERRAAKLAQLVDQMGAPEDTGPVKMWTFLLNGKPTSVVFHLDTLDVSLNGEELDADCQFTEAGSKTEFCLADHKAVIMTEVGQGRRDGQLVHSLYIDGNIVPE